MKPVDLLAAALADGVGLRLDGMGNIKVTGDGAAVNRWLPAIRERKAEIIDALKVGAGDTATSTWWFLHFPDRAPMEVAISPPATHAEILERYPDAVAAEPFDAEAFDERAAICEFDGGMDRQTAERLAAAEFGMHYCRDCRHLRGEVCSIASPKEGAVVVANRGYRPMTINRPHRCAGFVEVIG